MDFLKTLLAYVALTVAFSVQEGPLPQDVPTPTPPPPNAPNENRLMMTDMMKLKISPKMPPRRPMLPASMRNIARISRT